MQERIYRAPRFDQALARVKAELGGDAIILSSRELENAHTGKREVELRALPPGAPIPVTKFGVHTDGQRLLTRKLERVGVPTAAANTLGRAVARAHGGAPPSLAVARDALVEVLRREMIFAPALLAGGARVAALVGPTGVGKTTTVAKLAAKAALVEHRRVGLISVDDYRIAGAEQLGRYADLIGIPMEVAHDARSFEVALRRLADADLILVDTAGRSPCDTDATQRTAETLHGAQEAVEVQLCVASATGHAELRVMVEQHTVVRPRKLLITKLDEAVHHGGIIGAQVMAGLPLTYFTTGQRVPEDIEVASPERVASLLIGERLERS